jgi:hypothetical protein
MIRYVTFLSGYSGYSVVAWILPKKERSSRTDQAASRFLSTASHGPEERWRKSADEVNKEYMHEL